VRERGRAQRLWMVWLVVGAGIAVRLASYLYDRSFFWDEASLALNVLHRTYAQLLDKLDYTQVTPPLFLIASKLLYSLWGDLEYSLRLIPLVAGCVALLLLARIIIGLGLGMLGLCTISLFAFGVAHADWATSFKHYSSDQLCSVALLYFALRWERLSAGRRYLAAILLPGLLWASYTSAFALVGLVLVAAITWLKQRSRAKLVALALLSLSSCVSACLLYLFCVRNLMAGQRMFSLWSRGFPGEHFLVWLIRALTGVFATASGVPYAPALTLLICLWGFGKLVRGGLWAGSVLAGATLISAVLASLVRIYPLVDGRLCAYWAPIALFLFAKGLDAAHKASVNAGMRHCVTALAVAFAAASVLGLASFGSGLFVREEIRSVVSEIERTPDRSIPILVTHRARTPFQLYASASLVRRQVPLSGGTLGLLELLQGWQTAKRPDKFWLLISLADIQSFERMWCQIRPYVRVVDVIAKGRSKAILLQVVSRQRGRSPERYDAKKGP